MLRRVTFRVLVGMVLCLLVGPVRLPRAAARQGDNANQVIQLVNQYRANLGLPALHTHPSLMAAAQGHVDWMVRTSTYTHTGEGGSTPTSRALAAGYPQGIVYENWVSAQSPENAITWWDQSPVHQATLRLPNAVDIGVGYAADSYGGVYVLLMAWPTGSPEAPDGPPATAGPSETPGPIVVPVIKNAPGADGSIVHTVQEGQTLWDIAAVYGVDLREMERINNLGSSRMVHPGDKIIVRLADGQAPPPTPTPPTTHIVQAGETAWTVAALYGLTLDQLLTLNGIDRSTVLHPGDSLLIRQPDPTATETPIPTVTETPLPATPTFTPSPAPPASDTPIPTLSPLPTLTTTPTLTLTASPSAAPTAEIVALAVSPTLPLAPTSTPLTPVSSHTAKKPMSDQDKAVLVGAIILFAGLGTIMAAAGAAMFFKRG